MIGHQLVRSSVFSVAARHARPRGMLARGVSTRGLSTGTTVAGGDRDVEKKKTEKEFVALLRRAS